VVLTIVIAAPVSNRASRVSGRAGREFKKLVESKYPSVRVVFIPDDQCIHDHAGVLQKYKDAGPVFLTYWGHGVSKKICGSIPPHCSNTPHGMFDPDNVGLLKDVITYACACWTSHTLGRMAEEIGGKAYVGYRKPLFVGFDMPEHAYGRDAISVWQTFPLEMLAGNTVAGAIAEMGSRSRECENFYEETLGDMEYADYYLKRFRSNRDALVPFGDLRATLEI
jgi:hypothetical protein